MSFFTSIWDGLKDGLEAILRLYEGLLEPIFGAYAWGLSIILLTLTVRLFLVPLAVRQTKSMRAMQKLQPELKKIQKKYETDRSLMKTDPERYKALKEKQREAQMALYQEHSVNPVGGCLPLILQMPIFFALFSILRPDGNGVQAIAELTDAPFLGIDSLAGTAAGGAGVGAIVLVVLQVATTYFSTKQMQGRSTQAAAEQQQAQKIMLYVMPVFLGWLSWTFPIGVVLYWVTTNFWTIGQQAVVHRQVEAEEARAAEERAQARDAARAKRRSGSSSASDEETDEETRAPRNRKGGAAAKRPPGGAGQPGAGDGKASTGGAAAKRASRDAGKPRAGGRKPTTGDTGRSAPGTNGANGTGGNGRAGTSGTKKPGRRGSGPPTTPDVEATKQD